MVAYAFHLLSVRQGVDIQDALLFSKPHRCLDGRLLSAVYVNGALEHGV
jgi:hypothetical protein